MNQQDIPVPPPATRGKPQACRACQGSTRGHVIIDGRRVCPSRAKMREILYQLWSEGYHKFAEETARNLGMSLSIPPQQLLERLMVERRRLSAGKGSEEVSVYLPPVGTWDPDKLRRLRPDDYPNAIELDAHSQAPTLLVDSEDMTVRSGPAFAYWSGQGLVSVENRAVDVRDPSPTSEDTPDEFSSVQSSGVGTRFLNALRSFRSKVSTVTISAHPSDVAVVREAATHGGFRSMVVEPASVYDTPLVIVGRTRPALTQYVNAVKARARRDIWKSVILSNLVSFLASMVIVWYNLL